MEDPVGLTVVAGPDVASLGMSFTTFPPRDYPDVKQVTEGSWAESVGIEVGFAVLDVNGIDIIDMSKQEFLSHLKLRPVELYLEPPPPESPPSSDAGSDLGNHPVCDDSAELVQEELPTQCMRPSRKSASVVEESSLSVEPRMSQGPLNDTEGLAAEAWGDTKQQHSRILESSDPHGTSRSSGMGVSSLQPHGSRRSILKSVPLPVAAVESETAEELSARIRALEAENSVLREEARSVEELHATIRALEAKNEQLLQQVRTLEKKVAMLPAEVDAEKAPYSEESQKYMDEKTWKGEYNEAKEDAEEETWKREYHEEKERMLVVQAAVFSNSLSKAAQLHRDSVASAIRTPPIYFRTPSEDSERSHWFHFILASKIREWHHSQGPLPRQQDMSPDWLVALEMSLVGIFRLTYERRFLVVSHRWASEEHPDPSCTQLMLVHKYLLANPSVEYVWYDYSCLPQISDQRLEVEQEGHMRTSCVEADWSLTRGSALQTLTTEDQLEARRLASIRAMQRWWRAKDWAKKYVQHRKAELKYLQRSALFVWCLYLSMQVLIIQNKESMFRFWCCWETWLAMQCATKDGLVTNPSYLPQRDIVVHVDSVVDAEHVPVQGGLLRKKLAGKTILQVQSLLREGSLGIQLGIHLEVDRQTQLGVLERLEREVPQLYRWFKKRDDPMLKSADEYVYNLWRESSRRKLFLPFRGETLDLSKRGIDDDLLGLVAEELENTTVWRTLALGSNKITDVGAARLAEALRRNRTLEMLYINKNFISDAGVEKLILEIVKHQTLGRLDVEKNRLTSAGKERFRAILSQKMPWSFRFRD